MSWRLKSFLSERTILYMMVVFMATGLGMFIFVQSSVTTFKDDNIRKNMTWMGNSINYFCSSGYDQLAKVGANNDEIEVLLKQAEILEMIEDFSRNNDFKVEVYEIADVSFLLLLSSFSNLTAGVKEPLNLPLNIVTELKAAGKTYNAYVVSFDSWKWRVVLLRDARSFDGLLEKLRGFYLVMGVLVIMLTFVMIFFLRYSRESAKVLERSRMKLQETLDSLAEGVIVVNDRGEVSQINPSAKAILGISADEESCLGRHISNILSLEEIEKGRALEKTDFEKNGMLYRESGTGEFRLLNALGDEKLVHLRFTKSLSEERENRQGALVLSFTDITQNREIERKLQQAQKMEVVGLMAGGVAHDLNNILSGIVSYPELLLLRLNEKSELREPIEAIKQSGQRAAAIVADLLTVARGAASTKSIHDVNTVVYEYINSPESKKVQQQYPGINLKFNPESSLENILCSSVHVKKCLLNLMINSYEAIKGPDGVCTITTRNRIVTSQVASRLQVKPGGYVVISVADNGPGISPEHISHIFEPFFTKKKMGRSGTGLGLSVVWNTMLDHNGTAVVQSGREGTVFELYFPSTGREADTRKEEQVHTQFQGNGEVILVVDDDPLQRSIAHEFLLELNYEPHMAESGEEAVEKVKLRDFDLIVLDMIMEPGMNGMETYEKILEVTPNQKALIVSGFSESEDVKMTLSYGAGGFVKKPYSLLQLGKSIDRVLNR